jgi:hypothetical protein
MTGTVPFGEADNMAAGFALSATSRTSQRVPLMASAILARIA